MTAAGLPAAIAVPDAAAASRRARAVLAAAASIHFVHDGFSDVIYLLLPVWAAQFGLTYGQVGLLRTVYSGGMAAFQIPAGILAERWGEARLLAAGTAVTALGFLAAGLTGGFAALLACLVLGGLGSGVPAPAVVLARVEGLRDGAAAHGARHLQLRGRSRQGRRPRGGGVRHAVGRLARRRRGLRASSASWRRRLMLMALMHLDVGHAAPAAARAVAAPGPRGLGHRPSARVRGAVRHPRHRQLHAVGLPHAPALPAHRQGLDGSRGGARAHARVRRRRGGEVRVRRARRAARRHPHRGRHRGGDVRGHPPPPDAAARRLSRSCCRWSASRSTAPRRCSTAPSPISSRAIGGRAATRSSTPSG